MKKYKLKYKLKRSILENRSMLEKIFKYGFHFLFICLILFLTYLIIWEMPEIEINKLNNLNSIQKLTKINELRRTVAQILAGIGIFIGLYFSFRRIRAAERTVAISLESQITDRFTRAIEQIGNDNLSIRLGGIYSLEKILIDSPKDQGPIIEILLTYIRDNSPYIEIDSSEVTSKTDEDIQAILTILGRRNLNNDPKSFLIIIMHSNLNKTIQIKSIFSNSLFLRVNLLGVAFHRVDFNNTKFKKVCFDNSKFDNVNFSNCEFESVIFNNADFSGSDFNDTLFFENNKIRESKFWFTSFHQTNICGQKAENCEFWNAEIINSIIIQSDFMNSDFQSAKLCHTWFNGCNFENVNFSGCDLTEADISGSNLKNIKNWQAVTSYNKTNIFNVLNAPKGFIEYATKKGAIQEKPVTTRDCIWS